MSSISENYAHILTDIAATAARYGRDPADITLVAVSKTHSAQEISSVYNAGCRKFGESRVQEALEKMPLLPKEVQWHLIGTLQSNKVRKAIGKFSLIHSVDNFELAQKISEASTSAGCVTPILLQVNTSGELSKHGLKLEEWKRHFEKVLNLSGVQVEGLMTIAPYVEDEQIVRNCFARLRHLRDELAVDFGISHLRHLSMGMSHDYHIAIAEGSTILRIGSAIFGSKKYMM